MNPPYSIYRSTPTTPSRLRRLEVAALDLMIFAVESLYYPRLIRRVCRAWQYFDRQSPLRQVALLSGLGMLAFCLGLVKAAI